MIQNSGSTGLQQQKQDKKKKELIIFFCVSANDISACCLHLCVSLLFFGWNNENKMCMRFTLCTPHLLVVQHAKPPPSASIQTNDTDEGGTAASQNVWTCWRRGGKISATSIIIKNTVAFAFITLNIFNFWFIYSTSSCNNKHNINVGCCKVDKRVGVNIVSQTSSHYVKSFYYILK